MKSVKILSVALSAGILSTLFVGCGEETTTKGKYFDPPITLTTDRWLTGDQSEEDWDNLPYQTWCRETLGIIWKPAFVAADSQSHLDTLTMLAASNNLPDVIADAGDMLPDLYKSGHLRVVQDDIEQWGSDLIKYLWLEEMPERMGATAFGNNLTEDGKFYAIPHVMDPLESGTYEKLFIRADIVQELGYDNPTTIPELEEIMAAYKAKYPDQYPYRAEASFYGTSSQVFSVFGISPGWVYDDGTGNYVYGSTQPGMKETLALFRDWYKNGYIAPNFDTLSADAYNSGFINGEGLVSAGMNWFSNWSQTQLSMNFEDAVVEPLEYFKTTDGSDYKIRTWIPTGWPSAVSTNCEHPEAVIYEMNEFMESGLRNEKDLREMFDFAYPETELRDPINQAQVDAGEEDAKFDYPDDVLGPGFLNVGRTQNSPGLHLYCDTRAVSYKNNVNAVMEAFLANNRDVEATQNALTGSTKQWFITKCVVTTNGFGQSEAIYSMLKNNQIIDEAVESGKIEHIYSMANYQNDIPYVKDNWEKLTTMEMEYVYGIIKGERPLDDWDKFISEWKSQGGDQVLAEITEYNKNKVSWHR